MEGLTSFLQVAGLIIVMLTIYKGLSEYGKNNIFQRAKILESLIEKFKDKKLYIAKRLLDDFIEFYYDGIDFDKVDKPTPKGISEDITAVHRNLHTPQRVLNKLKAPETDSTHLVSAESEPGNLLNTDQRIISIVEQALPEVKIFTFISLEHLLRNHKGNAIGESEVYFRDSFDQLLDFYTLLIYYLRNEIITIREVRAHFHFHLLSVKKCPALLNYIQIYYEEDDFEWLFRQLPERPVEMDLFVKPNESKSEKTE